MNEGWGLARRKIGDQSRFYATDGSSKIFIIDPNTWKVEKTLSVNSL
jgi:glutamine cyclotransferase